MGHLYPWRHQNSTGARSSGIVHRRSEKHGIDTGLYPGFGKGGQNLGFMKFLGSKVRYTINTNIHINPMY